MSIAQGGNGFPFLAPPVYDYISSGKYNIDECKFDDIPDPVLKFSVKKVGYLLTIAIIATLLCVVKQIGEAENDMDIKAVFAIEEISDLLIQTGYRKPIPSLRMADKQTVITAMLNYHMMLKVKCAMDQYMEGLAELHLLERIQNNPSLWMPLFTNKSEKLTAG